MDSTAYINGLLAAYMEDSAIQWDGEMFVRDDVPRRILPSHTSGEGWNRQSSKDLLAGWTTADKNRPLSVSSRRFAIDQIKAHTPPGRPAMLEIGCGHGLFLNELRQAMPRAILIGSDLSHELMEVAATVNPGIPLIQMDICSTKIAANTLDAVVALNVLEHIEDHDGAVRGIHGLLKPGGVLVAEVPAGPRLYDAFDEHFKHYRRYTMNRLSSLLKNNGFDVLYKSHSGFFSYPLFCVVKIKNQLMRKAGRLDVQSCIQSMFKKGQSNPVVNGVFEAERTLGRFVKYPIGVRCQIVARKPIRLNKQSSSR